MVESGQLLQSRECFLVDMLSIKRTWAIDFLAPMVFALERFIIKEFVDYFINEFDRILLAEI